MPSKPAKKVLHFGFVSRTEYRYEATINTRSNVLTGYLKLQTEWFHTKCGLHSRRVIVPDELFEINDVFVRKTTEPDEQDTELGRIDRDEILPFDKDSLTDNELTFALGQSISIQCKNCQRAMEKEKREQQRKREKEKSD